MNTLDKLLSVIQTPIRAALFDFDRVRTENYESAKRVEGFEFLSTLPVDRKIR